MRKSLWLATLVLLGGGIVWGDTVYMNDGRVLHGRVTETADGISLTTRIGTITFQSSDVTSWAKDDTGLDMSPPPAPAPAAPPPAATEPSPVVVAPKPAPATEPAAVETAPVKPAPVAKAPAPAATAPSEAVSGPSTLPAVAGATTERSMPLAKHKNQAEIQQLLAQKWNDLGSLMVSADETVTGDEPGNWHVQFRFFGDRAYWERTPEGAGGTAPVSAAAADERLVRALLPDRVIQMDKSGVRIMKPSTDTFLLDDDLDVALGYRAPEEITWMTPDSLDGWKMKFKSADPETVTLSLAITPADEPKLNRVITLSRPEFYAVKEVTTNHSKGVQVEQIMNDGFQDVGGWKLPTKITVDLFGDDGQISRETKIVVGSYVVNDSANTPDSYMNFWPSGTRVDDETK
jgi:hypothetical protein